MTVLPAADLGRHHRVRRREDGGSWFARVADVLHRALARLRHTPTAHRAARHHAANRAHRDGRTLTVDLIASRLRIERAQLAAAVAVRRAKAATRPARERFAVAAGHARTAARATADAVGASMKRLHGAKHKHRLTADTAEHHGLARKLVKLKRKADRRAARAAGEMTLWQRLTVERTRSAW